MTEPDPLDDDATLPAPEAEETTVPPKKAAPRKRAPRKRTAASAPRMSAKPKPATAAPAISHADAVRGVLQLAAAPLIAAKDPALKADGAAILVHGDTLAVGLAEAAEQVPQLGALLDRLTTFGPFGALALAVAGIAGQIAANHRPELVKSLKGLGVMSRENIVRVAEGSEPLPEPDNGDDSPASFATAPLGEPAFV